MRYERFIAHIESEMVPENAVETGLILHYLEKVWGSGMATKTLAYEVDFDQYANGFWSIRLAVKQHKKPSSIDELCAEFGGAASNVSGRACLCADHERTSIRPYFDLPEKIVAYGEAFVINTTFGLIVESEKGF